MVCLLKWSLDTTSMGQRYLPMAFGPPESHWHVALVVLTLAHLTGREGDTDDSKMETHSLLRPRHPIKCRHKMLRQVSTSHSPFRQCAMKPPVVALVIPNSYSENMKGDLCMYFRRIRWMNRCNTTFTQSCRLIIAI